VSDRSSHLLDSRPDENPKGALNGASHVVKGGSYLSAPSHCAGYRPSARRAEIANATACDLGFRIAQNVG